jgi:hypothetical protein
MEQGDKKFKPFSFVDTKHLYNWIKVKNIEKYRARENKRNEAGKDEKFDKKPKLPNWGPKRFYG